MTFDIRYIPTFVNILISMRRYDLAYRYANKGAEQGIAECYIQLAHAYRFGQYYPINTDLTLELLESAYELGLNYAIYEIMDIKSQSDCVNLKKEAFRLSKKLSDKGDIKSIIRLVKYYHHGIGVEQNLLKAKQYVKLILDCGLSDADIEYFDILNEIGTPTARSTMIKHANLVHEKTKIHLNSRLAQCYLSGIGVSKNQDLAIKLLYELVENNQYKYAYDIADILYTQGTESALKERITLLTQVASKNDAGACGRLAQCYRDGKGVKQNRDVALQWMRKATSINEIWSNELIDLLLTFDNETYDEEAYTLCLKRAAYNAGAMVRLARMYYYGRHVSKDYKLANEWISKAMQLDDSWIKDFNMIRTKYQEVEKNE